MKSIKPKISNGRVASFNNISYDRGKICFAYIGTIDNGGKFLLYSTGGYNVYHRPKKCLIDRTGINIMIGR